LLEFLQLLEEEGSMDGDALLEASRLSVRKSAMRVWDKLLPWTAPQLKYVGIQDLRSSPQIFVKPK
jgi:hypothetical protein